MKASVSRAGYLGHIDGTIVTAPTNMAWQAIDYTVLNVLHLLRHNYLMASRPSYGHGMPLCQG
jgi:hypothetical protein